jgi:hypothetical protein
LKIAKFDEKQSTQTGSLMTQMHHNKNTEIQGENLESGKRKMIIHIQRNHNLNHT